MADEIHIEVVYARPEQQILLALAVPAGTTAIEAVRRSGILEHLPAIDLEAEKIGVFGRVVSPDHRLSAGDRVEIYRPLIADPKESRRRRAEIQRKAKRRNS